jgi:hypothetical protein
VTLFLQVLVHQEHLQHFHEVLASRDVSGDFPHLFFELALRWDDLSETNDMTLDVSLHQGSPSKSWKLVVSSTNSQSNSLVRISEPNPMTFDAVFIIVGNFERKEVANRKFDKLSLYR